MKRKEKKVKLYFIGNQGRKSSFGKENNFRDFFSLIIAATFFIGVSIGELPGQNSSYRSIITTAHAAPDVVKNFRYFAGDISDFFGKKYKLGNLFSMVKEGKGVNTNLNFSEYLAINLGANYFGPSALDILYLSSELGAGKTPALIKALSKSKNNYSRSFTPIPYKEFFEQSDWVKDDTWNYRDHSPVPQLTTNKGLPNMGEKRFNFKINFADGKIREFRPKEPFLALLPNVQEIMGTGSPSLSPQEALPFALMYYSKFYDKKRNVWIHKEELKEQIAMQYAIYAGIEINPGEIEIIGIAKRTRFLYHGPVGGNKTYVYRQENGDDKVVSVAVPVVNYKKELMMFGSMDTSQAIFIPISRLMKIGNDDSLLATNGSVFTYNNILEELAIARSNQQAKVLPLYGNNSVSQVSINSSSLVVKTKRLEIIANAIIGDAKTSNEALTKIKSFVDQTLPYGSDSKRDGWSADIQMTPLNTMVNGMDDCEGHATVYASLLFSATHKSIASANQYIGIMESSYTNDNDEVVGHISPMVVIPGRKTKTNPFPDHVLANINGQDTALFYVEATGVVPDPQGVSSLQRQAMEPRRINVFSGQGKKRVIFTAGLNEFKHFPDS